jgi:hypothetical protein
MDRDKRFCSLFYSKDIKINKTEMIIDVYSRYLTFIVDCHSAKKNI